MKILRVIAGVDPANGGPVEGLKLSAGVLETMGHQTEVVTLDMPQAEYLKSFPFRVHPQGRWLERYGYTPNISKWIVKNASRFDAAVIHGLWNHASIGGWDGLIRAGLPYAIFCHGMLDPWFKGKYPAKHAAKQLFWSIAQGRVLRDAGAVLFTSEEEQRQADGVFRHHQNYKGKVVAYGAAEPSIPQQSDFEHFRKLVPGLGDKRFILFLSRIHEKKGCDLLVNAFMKITQRCKDLDLVVAGPDETGMKLSLVERAAAAGIADRIHWPGMLTGDLKWAAFQSADAFVLPSHQENFGIAVAEALACGVPVLITNKVNVWREVETCGAGLVANDDLDGIEQLLRGWIELEDGKKTAMRQAARLTFEKYFTSTAAARDLLLVLQDCVANIA